MREITKLMIKEYALLKLKYDFMGYQFQRPDQLSYHHLIIPRCMGGEATLENGAVLVLRTSHKYLHLIEYYNLDMFCAITSEIIDQNVKGYIDYKNLKAIDDILTQFEREYCGTYNSRGRPIIKEEYTKRLVMKNRK